MVVLVLLHWRWTSLIAARLTGRAAHLRIIEQVARVMLLFVVLRNEWTLYGAHAQARMASFTHHGTEKIIANKISSMAAAIHVACSNARLNSLRAFLMMRLSE